jgi:2-oxoglutarate dehydrogenase E1 component
VFCSGKVFYDLNQHRNEKDITNTAILRVEQLYPFNDSMVKALVSQFPNVSKFVWCQEEPQNMGAWTFIAPHLMTTLSSHIRYAGRPAASSPATGAKATHKRGQMQLVEAAFNV